MTSIAATATNSTQTWGQYVTTKYNRWVDWTAENSFVNKIDAEADSTLRKVGKVALAFLPLLAASFVSAIVSTINFVASFVKRPAAPASTEVVDGTVQKTETVVENTLPTVSE